MSLLQLVDARPEVAATELLAGLAPPPLFSGAGFGSYRPDPAHPSQEAALARAQAMAAGLQRQPTRSGLLRRRSALAPARGIYFDGGYGVGKTHLLAALWHAAPEPKAYATFVELTSVTGVLGLAAAVEGLASCRLLAVDEFELDDPGDTVLMSTLLGHLSDRGVVLAATSNTQPEDLGEGRFAATDFQREIQGLASRFDIVRVDGPDYRHRGGNLLPAAPLTPDELQELLSGANGSAAHQRVSCDDFQALLAHLATLHPSRYGKLLDGVSLVAFTAVTPVADEAGALRLVVLVDRLYDREIPVCYSGEQMDRIFPAALLQGPHRKKYQRASSRLAALTQLAVQRSRSTATDSPSSRMPPEATENPAEACSTSPETGRI